MKRKSLIFTLLTLIFTASVLVLIAMPSNAVKAAEITSNDFLKANGKALCKNWGTGNIVQLRGTNAGGYMLQEFWMTPTESSSGQYNVTCEMDIYKTLTCRFGEQTMRDLVGVYQNNYWTTKDFDNCQSMGINCIRLPLWYMNFMDSNGNYLSNAFNRVDWFVNEAGKRGIYVILDMHGAPGSQNGSDHSGVDGGDAKEAASQFFFGNNANRNQQLYYDLWSKIAAHYKGNPTVAGYDLLNEPYCTYRYKSGESEDTLHTTLWNIYNNAYNAIRSVDKDHTIIMEATWDPCDLPDPSKYSWSNIMYEYHNYKYADYNNENGAQVKSIKDKVNEIVNQGYNVPSYMGEFSLMDNISAWQQGLDLLNSSNLSWTEWTYKVNNNNNNWGLYRQNVPKANVAADSADTIRSKWSNVGTSSPNTDLINAIKPYFTAPEPSNITDGQYYLTAIANNKVVCADNSGKDPLIANRPSCNGAWEAFTVVNNWDGTISLKSSANGKYVCAVIDSKNELIARSSQINTWEKFIPYKITDNQYALKSVANNNYVKADLNNNGTLYAASSSIAGAWEAFIITAIK
ncbi:MULTISPECIES: cellulase family glycosylhydrolase [Clostridium]|uniref:cellulase family glycosylhydrolase n=1 Tax=Clostridium TaxID=1485 RepID=UPI000825785C|nr:MULTISPECIES: cellulase family glycosylhydrolase [Clostridium]PJI10462.1 glycoside hydrolase [Clostridium sp. CT7]